MMNFAGEPENFFHWAHLHQIIGYLKGEVLEGKPRYVEEAIRAWIETAETLADQLAVKP
jgi:hypothetical protein